MDDLGKIIPAQRWGLYLYNPDGSLATVEVQGMANVETFVDLYQTVGSDVDPVLQYVNQNHAPAHEALLLPRRLAPQRTLVGVSARAELVAKVLRN